MVQLLAVFSEVGKECFKHFGLLRSASAELAKDVLCPNIRSGGVQADSGRIARFERVAHSPDNTPYFRGTGKSDHSHGFGALSLPIIIVVIMIEIRRLLFRVISGDNCICFHG